MCDRLHLYIPPHARGGLWAQSGRRCRGEDWGLESTRSPCHPTAQRRLAPPADGAPCAKGQQKCTPPTTGCVETFSIKWTQSRLLFWDQKPIFQACSPLADSLGLAIYPCTASPALRVSCRVGFGQTSHNELFQIT